MPITIQDIQKNYCNYNQSLYILSESLDTEDITLIVAYLKENEINKLYLSQCDIDDAGATILAENIRVKEVLLERNKIGNKGALALASNRYIEHLSLQDNNVTDEGLVDFKENTTLKNLNLRCNRITDEGALVFANALIKQIDLGWCSLTDVSAIALSKAHFKYLGLSGNEKITSKGTRALLSSETICELDIRSMHPMTNEDLMPLIYNKTLKNLTIWKREVDDKGAEIIAQNQSLRYLDLLSNKITDEGAKVLLKNKNLTQIQLGLNQLSEPIQKEIKSTRRCW